MLKLEPIAMLPIPLLVCSMCMISLHRPSRSVVSGLMAMNVLASADSTHVPSNGTVAGPWFAVFSNGVRMSRCLRAAVQP